MLITSAWRNAQSVLRFTPDGNVARSSNIVAPSDLTLWRSNWIHNIDMQFVPHRERCLQLSRNRWCNATQYCCHITAATEIQQGVPFALLRYSSLSTMSLWRFYVACNNKTYLLFVQVVRHFFPVLTKFGFSRFSLSSPIPNFTKIQPVGAGQTERTRRRLQALFATICDRA